MQQISISVEMIAELQFNDEITLRGICDSQVDSNSALVFRGLNTSKPT
jgi:hypothetical protein